MSGQGVALSGPGKVFFRNSPGTPGVLLGCLEGNQAREFTCLDLQDPRDAVVGAGSLTRILLHVPPGPPTMSKVVGR